MKYQSYTVYGGEHKLGTIVYSPKTNLWESVTPEGRFLEFRSTKEKAIDTLKGYHLYVKDLSLAGKRMSVKKNASTSGNRL